jgi:peptidoglycan/xylan/chitin deacetylase (PgdA/CDA1 family)
MAILGYHDIRGGFEANISSIPAGRVVHQLDWLTSRSYRFVSLAPDAAVAGTLSLTLDDALEHQVAVAMELLSDRSIPATLFVPTRYVGKRAAWDYQGRQRQHADWSMLRQWCAAGHSVGSHGASHRDLRTLADTELASELSQSKDELEAQLGQRVRYLSYPFGRTDQRVAEATKAAGYDAAYTTSPDGPEWVTYRRPRIMASLLDTALSLEQRISGTGWGRMERTKQRIISFWSGGTAWQQQYRGELKTVISA